MNETEKVSTTSHALKNNTMFRDLIIRRERQKALRASLYAHQRKATHAQQETLRQQTVRQMPSLQQNRKLHRNRNLNIIKKRLLR